MRTYGCQMNVHDSERIGGLLDVTVPCSVKEKTRLAGRGHQSQSGGSCGAATGLPRLVASPTHERASPSVSSTKTRLRLFD